MTDMEAIPDGRNGAAGGPLDEMDLRVVNALQVAPRAPWSVLARGVGADPATVARRWERLRERGLAWTAVYPGMLTGVPGACVDLVCEAGRLDEVARVLAGDPECVSLDITSGERNLMLSVRAADERSLTGYVLDRVAVLPGVVSVRIHLMVSSTAEGGKWRLRALDRSEAHAVRAEGTSRPADAGDVCRQPWFWEAAAAHGDSFARAVAAGVRVAMGTDSGVGRTARISANCPSWRSAA